MSLRLLVAISALASPAAWPQQLPVLFAGTDAGIHRSRNGGRSWQRVSEGLGNARVSVVIGGVRNDGRILFAGTNLGLYKSTDAGEHWTTVLTEKNVISISVDVADEQRVYAVASGRLFASIDGGATWSGLTTPWPVTAVATDPYSTFRLYVSAGRADGGGLAASTDRGATWQRVPLSVATPLLTTDPTTPGRLFASPGPVLSSRDYGQSWFLAGPYESDLTAFIPEEFHFARPWSFTALTADPFRPGDAHICLTAITYQVYRPDDEPDPKWRSRLVHGWGSLIGNLWSTGVFPNGESCLAVLREPQAESVLFGAGTKIYRRESLQSTRLGELADLGSTIRSLAAVRPSE